MKCVDNDNLKQAAIEHAWQSARGLKDGPGGRRRSGRGRVMLAGKPIGDAPTACAFLGISPETIYGAIRHGYVMVKVPLEWEFPDDRASRRIRVSYERVLPDPPADDAPVARSLPPLPLMPGSVRRRPAPAPEKARRTPERPDRPACDAAALIDLSAWERRHNH